MRGEGLCSVHSWPHRMGQPILIWCCCFFFLFEFRLFCCRCLYIWLRLCFFVRFRLFCCRSISWILVLFRCGSVCDADYYTYCCVFWYVCLVRCLVVLYHEFSRRFVGVRWVAWVLTFLVFVFCDETSQKRFPAGTKYLVLLPFLGIEILNWLGLRWVVIYERVGH